MTNEQRKAPLAEYTCAVCHETYEKGWSDDMAQAELGLNFGEQFVSDECEGRCSRTRQKGHKRLRWLRQAGAVLIGVIALFASGENRAYANGSSSLNVHEAEAGSALLPPEATERIEVGNFSVGIDGMRASAQFTKLRGGQYRTDQCLTNRSTRSNVGLGCGTALIAGQGRFERQICKKHVAPTLDLIGGSLPVVFECEMNDRTDRKIGAVPWSWDQLLPSEDRDRVGYIVDLADIDKNVGSQLAFGGPSLTIGYQNQQTRNDHQQEGGCCGPLVLVEQANGSAEGIPNNYEKRSRDGTGVLIILAGALLLGGLVWLWLR